MWTDEVSLAKERKHELDLKRCVGKTRQPLKVRSTSSLGADENFSLAASECLCWRVPYCEVK